MLQEIVDIRSSFVCRIRDNAKWHLLEEKLLTEKAIRAGIVFDETVELGGDTAQTKLGPVRIIAVKCNPNTKRHHTVRRGPCDDVVMFITAWLDCSDVVNPVCDD